MNGRNAEVVRTEPRTFQVKVYRKLCAFCGKEFEGGARAKFCSPSCRVRDFDRRNPEKARERRRRSAARRRRPQD